MSRLYTIFPTLADFEKLRTRIDVTLTLGDIELKIPSLGNAIQPVFVDNEIPLGSCDGVNAYFLLSASPFPPQSLHLFRNGILQQIANDFILEDQKIKFLSFSIPQLNDSLLASYRIEAAEISK